MSLDLLNLSDNVWMGYANDNLSELTGNQWYTPLAQLGLNYGADAIRKLLINRAQPAVQTSHSPTPKAIQNLNLGQDYNLTAPTNPTLKINFSTTEAPTLTTPELDLSLSKLPKHSLYDALTAADTYLDTSPKLSNTLGKIVQGAGMAAGMLGSYAGNVLGSAIFGNSKGGLAASGALSLVAGQAAGAAGTLIATNIASGAKTFSGVGSSVSSAFSNAGAMTSLGAGVANVALDALDPVKKSKWENAANIGLGLASLLTPYTALAALAFNGIGHATGKTTDGFTADVDTLSETNGSFGGSVNNIIEGALNANTKYSGWNRSGYRKAEAKVLLAIRELSDIRGIMNDNSDRHNILYGSNSVYNIGREVNMEGGYDLRYALKVARNGMKINLNRVKEVCKLLKGNKLPEIIVTPDSDYNRFLNSLPDNLKYGEDYQMKRYWELFGKPKNFLEALARNMFVLYKDGYHARTVAENPETGEIEFMKSSKHPTLWMELEWYNNGNTVDGDGNIIPLNAEDKLKRDDFYNNYELVTSEPYYKYIRRQIPLEKQEKASFKEGGILDSATNIELIDPSTIEDIEEFKEGGTLDVDSTNIELIDPSTIEDIEEFKEGGTLDVDSTNIELIDPSTIEDDDEIEVFLNGGSVNVIPEGALHARKHNMEDAEHLTKKGIPVVDNMGELHAEIEREEVILRLELTKKLEELAEKYYSEETSNKEKEEAALEAGKLLTDEILNNTQDNTNILL